MNLTVLYEDNHLIAVDKPAGILTQADAGGEVSLMEEVKRFLKEKYQKPGNVFLGLIHRLDKNVSGIVLFAKTSKGASRLSEQWRNHSVEKTYHAWVHGSSIEKSGTLVNYLEKNERTNKTRVSDEKHGDAQYAELDYEVVETKGDFALVKVLLKTGRSHQIRAQFSHIRHPLVGDTKYGSTISFPDTHIALRATSLAFHTATEDEPILLEVSLPTLEA